MICTFGAQMDVKSNIALCTTAFPYLHAEYPFISAEFDYLQKHTSLALILTHQMGSEKGVEVQNTIDVVMESELKNTPISFTQYVQFGIKVLIPMGIKLAVKSLINGSFSVKALKMQISQYLIYLRRASQVDAYIKSKNITVLYSYWFDHWNAIACVYKVMFNKDIIVVSRAHRYEVDYIKNPVSFDAYRYFQFKHTDRVYFISKTWMDLIERRIKPREGQFLYRPMGVCFNSKYLPVEVPSKPPYHILSISPYIPLKRLDFLASTIENMGMPLIWHHFGEKNLNNDLTKRLKGTSVDYKCYGYVNTDELLRFMETNPIHFLVNVSTIEGVPVSMMEAISRGIPLIGTNVGGVSEIISDEVGYLIDADLEIAVFAQKLHGWLANYKFGTIAQRNNIIQYGIEKFDQETNYTQFCNELNQLSS
jgi:glycosyltransferase involved in cell wall biosynthesis